jgi:hypothetical protein
MKYLNKLNEALQKLEVIVKGCSKEEILKIEKLAVNRLPSCYIEFLEIGGKDMDRKKSLALVRVPTNHSLQSSLCPGSCPHEPFASVKGNH